MEINQIKDRIEKKKAQIEKLNKKIAKWEAAKTEKAFIKDMSNYIPGDIKSMNDLIAWRMANDPMGDPEAWLNFRYEEYLKDCDAEIRRAQNELDDAQNTLDNYVKKLNDSEQKASIVKVKPIWDFLQLYKHEFIDYVKDNINDLLAYYEINREASRWRNDSWRLARENKEEYKRLYREYEDKEKEALAKVHSVTKSVYNRNSDDHINYEKLNDILDKDIENKYWNMLAKVTKYVGDVTDASNLSIGNDGNLNGIIIGTDGKAKLETIFAGGYNQDIIVNTKHGQVLHFRLLVHPVK